MTMRRARTLVAAALAAWGGLALLAPPARADHAMNRSCLDCHSLRSANVKVGTRNLKLARFSVNLYNNYWYCGTSFTPGNPVDCAYCHGDADVGLEIGTRSAERLTLPASGASAHPVDVAGATISWGAKRIRCNDCHGGDVNGGGTLSDLTPWDTCSKGATSGYPNHQADSGVTFALGTNRRIDKNGQDGVHLGRPSVGATPGENWRYGQRNIVESGTFPTPLGIDWSAALTGTNKPLCLRCHDGTRAATRENVQASYDRAGGGHNLTGVGLGALDGRKLPCYDCHDPHASQNSMLIIDGEANPAPWANPYQTTYTRVADAPTKLFNARTRPANDRVVCYGCHQGYLYDLDGPGPGTGVAVENVGTAFSPVFSFHKAAHTGISTAGNCLQQNGGCHQGPHAVDTFACLDCHSKAVTDAIALTGVTVNARLLAVNQADSEFGHIGRVGVTVNGGTANFIRSAHSIPYGGGDLKQAANNGCLHCHDTRSLTELPGTRAWILKDADGNGVERTRPLTLAIDSRTGTSSLDQYNRFCLSCHDGAGVAFTQAAGYLFSDGAAGVTAFPAATLPSSPLTPPKVNNPTSVASWTTGYYFRSGHGRGTSGTTAGTYPRGPGDTKTNAGAAVPCLECHLYHGSTAPKLLPGWRETQDGRGRVVKGATYSPESVGTKLAMGGGGTSGRPSTVIDYTDYTAAATNSRLPTSPDQFLSRYYSDYRGTTPWSTHLDGSTITSADLPNGTKTYFGTSGDLLANTRNAGRSMNPGQTAANATWVGFCNMCHLANDNAQNWGVKSGADGTYGLAYTHQGIYGALDADGKELKSQKNFAKDCVECHDPHGSGRGTAGDTADENILMIRRKIKHALTTDGVADATSHWSAVAFKSRTGTDSFDELDSGAGANNDDLCAVCHILDNSAVTPANADVPGVKFHYRALAAPNHQEDKNCTTCHNPDKTKWATASGNRRWVKFDLQNLCTGCHGLPPLAPCDVATDPANELPENYPGGGGAHKKHVDFLRARVGVAAGAFDDRLCTPCHGPSPGSAGWHLESGNPAAWTWPGVTAQRLVDLVDGAGNWGASGRYHGGASGTAQEVRVTANAKGGEPQRCANFACHGPGAARWELDLGASDPFSRPTVSGALRWDQPCIDGGGTSQRKKDAGRANACAGCHAWEPGAPATSIVVGGTPGYTSALGAQGATANYFGTLSGYARGGHGDPKIQTEDPAPGASERPDSLGTVPLGCAECHDDTVAHFPEPAAPGNLHRLRNPTIEDNAHTKGATIASGSLCSFCHLAVNYPGRHHPSYFGPTVSNPTPHAIVPAPTQEVLQPLVSGTNWSEVPLGSGHYEQDHYGVTTVTDTWSLRGNPDRGRDWWAGSPGTNRSPPARPVFYGEGQSAAPKANLPLEHVVYGTGSSNRVMCVTCHNPHGTDLYTHDFGGVGRTIPDNNMLRLRDSDNTLCNACH